LPSFGEKLKLEREKRKITLEQISTSTKIGTRLLQAMEDDKFDQLPGGIFNKGFVRAYARFVGLDEDQTVADYMEASGDAPPVSTEIATPIDEEREHVENIRRLEATSDTPTRELPWGLFAAVLLVVALTLSLWSRHQREHAKQSVRPAPATVTTPAPSDQMTGAGTSGVPSETPVEDTGAGSPSAASPVREPAPSTPASPSSTKTLPATPPKPQSAALQERVPAATPGQFTVVVEVRKESWVSITADGKTLVSQVLAPGSAQTVRGRKEIIVKTGNAAGVGFLFNGKKLDLGGESGQVKTVTFGPQGIAPNAAEAPATP
jgi:cytoskeleton protein RodZ